MASLGSSLAHPPAEDLQPSRVKKSKAAQRAKSKSSTWFLGSWNVRSLLDCDGSVETARQRSEAGAGLSVDIRKIDQVIRELERYQISVAALQETKWYNNAMYKVKDSIVLAAGRPTPSDRQPNKRGEGVAIVLRGTAVSAWKKGGKQGKSWSSRLITAVLQPGNTNLERVHIISCYAPTYSANRSTKDKFLNELQQALDAVPPSEFYIIMGDFNARVGSRTSENDHWAGARGPHVLQETNEAGGELLTFLSTNEASVCNTWFAKRKIHKTTWKHPKTKRWHCIDFAIMRRRDLEKCLDMGVKRGTECNTDHQLLLIKLRVKGKGGHHQPARRSGRKQFAVEHLTGRTESNSAYREAYSENVSMRVEENWGGNGTVEEKWSVIRSALVEAATEVLGHGKKRQPDWFQENEDSLEPFFKRRNHLYSKWLSSNRAPDYRKFVKARQEARKAVREAKNTWFREKSDKAQRGRFGGKEVWRSILDMQHAWRSILDMQHAWGLKPQRNGNIKDENGDPCTSKEAKQQRWKRHFAGILNVVSHS